MVALLRSRLARTMVWFSKVSAALVMSSGVEVEKRDLGDDSIRQSRRHRLTGTRLEQGLN